MQSKLWFKKVDGLVAAFMIPLVAMMIIFMQRGIFPFGDESFLRTDMYHQYAPFFSEFKHKLDTGGSLLYSWNIGLGINFSALYAYYLASPLNWLVLLVPKSFVLEFMTYMIVLKIALSGLTFAYYLSEHGRKEKAGIAFFGTFYALSGYMAAYNWNIMWLDCIWLFPLICLGIERLVFNKKGFLYAFSLGISITSNYYISIMICLFMVIYFAALIIIKRKKDFRGLIASCFRFILYSLLAGGISAVVLLPEVYALKDTASGEFNFPKTFTQYFSIIDMFARHMPGVKTEIGLDHWPNIYCGVAVYLFLILYLLNKRISAKEKIIYFIMLLFMLASFSIDVLNYIWHGLHFPNSLPARQSFIYIFLILYMSYRAYYNLNWNTLGDIGIAGMGSIGFIILCQEFVTTDHFTFGVFYASMILIGIYSGLLYLYKSKKININIILMITALLVLCEAMLNTGLTSVSTVGRSDYMDDNKSVKAVLGALPKSDFYRIEKVNRKTKNDGAWMNFPTVSLFSSTARASLSNFFKDIGVESSTNAYSITGSTPLVDMLFGVKYALYTGESEIPYLNLIASDDNIYLYENIYTLPLGYMVGPGFETSWNRELENPADVQNNLCQIIGVPNVLVVENGEIEGEAGYRFKASKPGLYYAFSNNGSVEDVRVLNVETGVDKTFEHVNRRYMLDLGYLEKDVEMSITSPEGKALDLAVYRFDMEALREAYRMLTISTFDILVMSDNYIEGDVEAGPEEVLLTSIPYDKGWKVTVDGKEVEAREGIGTFLAIDMTEGKHHITMEYMPEGLVYGAYLTVGSILFLCVLYLIRLLLEIRKRSNKKKQAWEREERRLAKNEQEELAKLEESQKSKPKNRKKEASITGQLEEKKQMEEKEQGQKKNTKNKKKKEKSASKSNINIEIKNQKKRVDQKHIIADIEIEDGNGMNIQDMEMENLENINLQDVDIQDIENIMLIESIMLEENRTLEEEDIHIQKNEVITQKNNVNIQENNMDIQEKSDIDIQVNNIDI